MFTLTDETIINSSPEPIFEFLTKVDCLYKVWHPRDHEFFHTLRGQLNSVGGIVHFFEWIGRFPLYGIARVSKIETNRLIEYELPFPVSLLRIGVAGFCLEPISQNETKLIAYVKGNTSGFLGEMLEKVIFIFIPRDKAKAHMKEEGENVKRYIENSPL